MSKHSPCFFFDFFFVTGFLWWEGSCLCCCGGNLFFWFFCCHFLAKKEVSDVQLTIKPLCFFVLFSLGFQIEFQVKEVANLLLFQICIKRGKMPGLTFSNELISRDEVSFLRKVNSWNHCSINICPVSNPN